MGRFGALAEVDPAKREKGTTCGAKMLKPHAEDAVLYCSDTTA
jgi:hypothetical protein